MTETAGWQFDIEVHPPGWDFPAGNSWVAGWLWSKDGRLVSDLRAWIDGRSFLAIHGLPKTGLELRLLQRPGPPYLGFTIQIDPHAGARLFRLEVRDEILTIFGTHGPRENTILTVRLFGQEVPLIFESKQSFDLQPWMAELRKSAVENVRARAAQFPVRVQ